MNTPNKKGASSVDLVSSNIDLINEILLRVSARSVSQFKLVSKQWLSLISQPKFIIRHTHLNFNFTHGLVLAFSMSLRRSKYAYMSFDEKSFKLIERPQFTCIMQSCNGLLLCFSADIGDNRIYYVFNPTTKRMTRLPQAPAFDYDVILAFDPSDSQHSPNYKVVCLDIISTTVHVYMYSSETKSWKFSLTHSFEPSTVKSMTDDTRVVWNGAIHWMSPTGNGVRFSLDQERFQEIPRPPLPNYWTASKFKFFGESGDYLQFIGLDDNQMETKTGCQYVVYAMGRDSSEWFVKYQLDMDAIIMAYPQAFEPQLNHEDMAMDISEETVDVADDRISIWSVVEERNVKGSYMVLKIQPNKIISYNFKDKTVKELGIIPWWISRISYIGKYMETLCDV